jgi:hypothetical protein
MVAIDVDFAGYLWCPDVSATGGFSQVLAGVGSIGRDQLH